MANDQVWSCELIRMEVSGSKPVVIQSSAIPKDTATEAVARQILINKWADRKKFPLIEAVRFLDENGVERFRYDVIQLMSERVRGNV